MPDGASTGEIWVFHGDDDALDPANDPALWLQAPGTFPLNAEETAAANYIRITLRHDYGRAVWDLFIDGNLAAANLGFGGRGALLDCLEFFGGEIEDVLIDDLSAESLNMLFADADKDGLPDSWETANGSDPNVYDRDEIDPVTGKSWLENYMDSLWSGGGTVGGVSEPPPGSIPPLTVLGDHQPVGALKGALSVGGDGSATYSIPIDIPKGTAGMEPKLSLNYSSNGANGPFGLGWSLGGLQQIVRGSSSRQKDGVTDGVDFEGDDRFYLDGERLVCVSGTCGQAGSEYRTEIDSFARITFADTPVPSWTIQTKSGLVVTLGAAADSRNDAAGMSPYCHVLFNYESRPDVRSYYSAGLKQTHAKRVESVSVKTGGYENHRYEISYLTSEQTGRSLLNEVKKVAQGNEIPSTVFEWDTLGANDPKWVEFGGVNFTEYGSGQDSGSGMDDNTSTATTGTIRAWPT